MSWVLRRPGDPASQDPPGPSQTAAQPVGCSRPSRPGRGVPEPAASSHPSLDPRLGECHVHASALRRLADEAAGGCTSTPTAATRPLARATRPAPDRPHPRTAPGPRGGLANGAPARLGGVEKSDRNKRTLVSLTRNLKEVLTFPEGRQGRSQTPRGLRYDSMSKGHPCTNSLSRVCPSF